MIKKIIAGLIGFVAISSTTLVYAAETETEVENLANSSYLQAVISIEEAIEAKKSTIFDASKSFIPYPDRTMTYIWDFGDGNKNEGIEVLHAYKEPGRYAVSLSISDEYNTSEIQTEVFAYRKLLFLLTDQTEVEERIGIIKDFAEKKGVHIQLIESFGSSTEFISEEILSKKLTEQSSNVQKADQIIVWTKENAGINALSRFIQSNKNKLSTDFSQKTITVISSSISTIGNRIQRQFEIINPSSIIIAKEAAIYPLIESKNDEEFIDTLEKGGYEYMSITEKTGKIRPWNFMSYFVNLLINKGIPDNTIALLLLLPIIATVVAFMKQVVGVTTFGIYTPSIITLSFLVIGLHAGLLTLAAVISIGALLRPFMKKIKMLFIPKMAIILTLVSLVLFMIIILSLYLGLFTEEFLSIAIFPMLILSTLVEKFVGVKAEKNFNSATALMLTTTIVAIIAFFIVGGEVNIGLFTIKFDFVKNLIMTYPELILLLIFINVLLGKWTGLRVLERIRFREVFRHIEE